MKPIETWYGGRRFRSRTEARWAVFMDAAAIAFDYEPEGFDFGGGLLYLPDFWLPGQRAWMEIKGDSLTKRDRAKVEALALEGEAPVYVFTGEPRVTFSRTETWDAPTVPEAALFCGRNGGVDEDRPYVWTQEAADLRLEWAGAADWPHAPRLLNAYGAAMAARFEYGQTPQPNWSNPRGIMAAAPGGVLRDLRRLVHAESVARGATVFTDITGDAA